MTGTERLQDAFRRRSAESRKVLVPYLTGGDPDLDTTRSLLRAAADAGADIIELGVPYSDPSADGPVLQAAAERALKRGVSLADVIDVAREVSAEVPVILFGYLNPFFQFGFDRLAKAAAAAGICGVLAVDLPYEEAGPFVTALRAEGLALVPLLTPVTPDARIIGAQSVCDAFGYYVSVTGVTGGALGTTAPTAARLAEVRRVLGRPIVVGFGIRTADDARAMAQGADGVVVGSALVDLAFRTEPRARAQVALAFLRGLRAAV